MKDSSDTSRVSSPSNFVKDQQDASKTEKVELIANAEKLEKEQMGAITSLGNDEAENGKISDSHAENTGTPEKGWELYKAIEWAGNEYTENMQPVDQEELSSASRTSQPAPQFLSETVGHRDTEVVYTTNMVDSGAIEKSREPFVKVGSKDVTLKKERSKSEIDDQDMMIKSCSCLPGYCTCGNHWTFQGSNSMQHFRDHKSGEASEDTFRRTDSELKAAGIYAWKGYECPCSHSHDSIQYSSEEKEDLIVATVASEHTPRITEEDSCSCNRRYEQTVVIIKPDAMIFEDVIRRAFVYVGGLHIVNERRICLSPEQVSEIYSDKYYGSGSYPLFVLRMSRVPILVLSVSGLNVMQVIQSMVGNDKLIPTSWFLPESMKRRFVISEDSLDLWHIAEDAQQSSVETRYFFPQMLIEPIPIIPSRITDFFRRYLDPTLSKGLTKVARTKPVDPILFLAEWLLTHNPFQPWYKPQQINMVPT